MEFHLRIANVADVSRIATLIGESVRGLQAGDYSAAQIEGALATVFTIDSQLIADGSYFVAETEAGELAGCGGWSSARLFTEATHRSSGSNLNGWTPLSTPPRCGQSSLHRDLREWGWGV